MPSLLLSFEDLAIIPYEPSNDIGSYMRLIPGNTDNYIYDIGSWRTPITTRLLGFILEGFKIGKTILVRFREYAYN